MVNSSRSHSSSASTRSISSPTSRCWSSSAASSRASRSVVRRLDEPVVVVDEVERARAEDREAGAGGDDPEVRELGVEQHAVVREALDAAEAGFVLLEPGLAERVVGSVLRRRVARSARVAAVEARLVGEGQQPAEAASTAHPRHVVRAPPPRPRRARRRDTSSNSICALVAAHPRPRRASSREALRAPTSISAGRARAEPGEARVGVVLALPRERCRRPAPSASGRPGGAGRPGGVILERQSQEASPIQRKTPSCSGSTPAPVRAVARELVRRAPARSRRSRSRSRCARRRARRPTTSAGRPRSRGARRRGSRRCRAMSSL